jgi:hypothetical protein
MLKFSLKYSIHWAFILNDLITLPPSPVRYHLDEDPKTLKVFTIPLHDAKGATCYYDHMSVSPNGKILAVTSGSTLQWLCPETGSVLDTAEKAHEGWYCYLLKPSCHVQINSFSGIIMYCILW